MQDLTTGKGEKQVPIRCVDNDDLSAVAIQNRCFLLVLLSKGYLDFEADGCFYHAVAPCFVCFHERTNPVITKPSSAYCMAVYFHPVFLNCNMSFGLLYDAQYKDIASNHDLFLLKPFLDGPSIIPIAENVLDHAVTTFHNMHAELTEQRDWYWSCRSRSYFMEWMIMLERMYGRMGYGQVTQAPHLSVDATDDRLKRAIVYIETHYTDSLDMTQISEAAGINRVTLSHLFKQEYGMTVGDYIKRYRLDIAKKQLLFTALPIKEIAVRCGFKTVPHFGRLFKEMFGATPAQYRNDEVTRRKTAMQLRQIPTADVVLDEIAGNAMYYTARERFPLILKIAFYLEMGPIYPLDNAKRRSFFAFDSDLEDDASEQEYFVNTERLRAHAKNGFPIRIWRIRNNVTAVCLFAYLCDVLREYDCPIEVIDHPDPELQSWGLMEQGECFEDYVSHAKPLEREEKEQQAALWRRLQQENTLFRVLENGTVRSVSKEYYDDGLLPHLPTAQSGVVWLKSIAADIRIVEHCCWNLYRICTFIENGVLEYVPLEGVEHSEMIRHKEAPKSITTEDMCRIAIAHMPKFPKEKAPHLPEAQVWVLLSLSNKVYVVANDDIEMLQALLLKNQETRIIKWVTMWWHGRVLDLPSHAARQALLALDAANADTQLILQNGERSLISTMP